MRPSQTLLIILLLLLSVDFCLYLILGSRNSVFAAQHRQIEVAVSGLGLTDLCISTEARYTRHPAVSDSIVPFMDYPGAYEHFPTGTFWAPVFQR